VALPEDDVSRFLFGLYRDSGAIRVRRAETVALGQAQEAHARRVIEAWTAAAHSRPDPALRFGDVRPVPIRGLGVRAWLRSALQGARHAR
jgi:hypothetical protein